MKDYCMYLRKSRADADAESRGEGETLARHQSILTELAERHKMNVVRIYKEIVSGDSIAARPQMQALLADVADGAYAGVLVVEIERLARGDTIDQGIVAQTFRDSSTLIVTPTKTYDPDNEFDEEYFEFSLFMSRREYKTIKRRMQAGRLASVKEGNYISSSPPFGYCKVSPHPKIHTLSIVPGEAEIVRLIYSMYLDGHGARYIAGELNRMGVSPQKSRYWQYASIRKILSNPLYCGKIGWKTRSNGDTLFQGLHEPIISEETFNAVQLKKRNDPAAQLHSNAKLMNHYHNILFCQNCGHQMKRRFITGSGQMHLLCTYGGCRGRTVSSNSAAVDEAVMSALRYRVSMLEKLQYTASERTDTAPDTKAVLAAELAKARRQIARLHDLLEQEVYDVDTFMERSAAVNDRISAIETAISETDNEQGTPELTQATAVKCLGNVIGLYTGAAPEEKNRLLHSAFSKICYSKTRRISNGMTAADLSLEAFFL